MDTIDFERWRKAILEAKIIKSTGFVTRVIGLTIEARGIKARIGEVCDIMVPGENRPVKAEVVGFREDASLLMPLGELRGIYPGCKITPTGNSLSIAVVDNLQGKVLDGLGHPITGSSDRLMSGEMYPVDNLPPNPMERRPIRDVLSTGVRAIDALLTCGRGQRIGIFSGSGVGKSTLLGMIARYSNADVNVIALIGERGREVLDFIESDLGLDGLDRSVVVAATSDQPALVRLKGAFVASAIAEYYREQGKNVLLLMDSVTRFAMSQREVGLAIGEPPATKGYTPSVFAMLPKLLERSGTSLNGSITAFYTVLVDGDDMNEPIADAVRGILDGHIVLSRELAARNHYPAIDVLNSVSRLMTELATPEHLAQASGLKEMLATYKEAEDMINIGAYKLGTNPKIDRAIKFNDQIINFLCQDQNEYCSYGETATQLSLIGKE